MSSRDVVRGDVAVCCNAVFTVDGIDRLNPEGVRQTSERSSPE
jgi:hypothetical protein